MLIAMIGVVAFASCDVVSRVIIWNPDEKREVIVKYGLEHRESSFWSNSDTLVATSLDNQKDSAIIINKVDSTTYRFQIPENHCVELQPKSFGTPIEQIGIIEKRRPQVVNINGQDWKKLKRAGIVETKGVLFIREINVYIGE